MLAGVALCSIGGNLFSGSLEVLAQSFGASRMRMEPLAYLFGEGSFGRTSQVVMGAVEGLLLGGRLVPGLALAMRSEPAGRGGCPAPPRSGEGAC